MLAESWSRAGGQCILLWNLPAFLQQSRLVSMSTPKLTWQKRTSQFHSSNQQNSSNSLLVHCRYTTKHIWLYCIICRLESLWWRSTVWIIHVCFLGKNIYILWEVSGRRNDVKSCLQASHVTVCHPAGLIGRIWVYRKTVLMPPWESYSEVRIM